MGCSWNRHWHCRKHLEHVHLTLKANRMRHAGITGSNNAISLSRLRPKPLASVPAVASWGVSFEPWTTLE